MGRKRITADDVAVLDKTTADIENELMAANPGGLPIITGGTVVGHVPGQGQDIMVIVTDTNQPQSTEFLPVSISWRGGEISRRFRLNTPTLLPEALVRHLEGNTLIHNTRAISPESAMYGNKAAAELQNPGMRYYENENGAYLTKTVARYLVRRVSPDEMRQQHR